MAAKKRTGLGRGIGALIPPSSTAERPVCFFSAGKAAESADTGEETASTAVGKKPGSAQAGSASREPDQRPPPTREQVRANQKR